MSLNLFEPNDELLLPPPAGGASTSVPAAVTVLCPVVRDVASSRLACLQRACEMIERECPSHGLWLLIVHTAWQPDTKVARHKKLWGLLPPRFMPLPNDQPTEGVLESPDGIKFYAAVRVPQDELVRVIGLLAQEPASLLLSVPDGRPPPVQDCLAAGWGRRDYHSMEHWREMATVAMRHDSIVFRPFGAFDDREAGFNLIASPELVRRLASGTNSQS